MSQFDVRTNELKREALSEQEVARRLRNLSAEISRLGSALSLDSSAATQVRRKIMETSRNVQALQQRTAAYASALSEIAEAYRSAERSIQGRKGTLKNVRRMIDKLANTINKILKDSDIVNENKGSESDSTDYNGDPVNMATGNFAYERSFLQLGGLFPMHVSLFYNSMQQKKSALGSGWNHNYDISSVTESDKVEIRLDDGHSVFFVMTEEGTYRSRRPNISYKISENGGIYTNENGLYYYFDNDGRVRVMRNQNGNSLAFTYDETNSQNLIKVHSNSGEFLLYQYDEEGKLTDISDSTGRCVHISFEDGFLRKIRGEIGQTFQYSYDKNGFLESITNPRGIVTLTNEYDDKGRVISQSLPGNSKTKLEYDDANGTVIFTEANGNAICYRHDNRYRSVQTDHENGTEISEYDENNHRISYTDRRGNTSYYNYNEAGNLIRSENACGEAIEIEYNDLHLAEKVSLNGEDFLHNSYDHWGNLVSRTDALGRTTVVSYDENGRPRSITQADGSEIHLSCDKHGNIVEVDDPIRGSTHYEYNETGKIIASVNASGSRTEFKRDARGNILSVKNALGNIKKYKYDECGQVTDIEDFDGSTIHYLYNEAGKIAAITDPDGGRIHYKYDRSWDLTDVTFQNGTGVHMDYDRQHNVVRMTDPVGTVTRYEYDANGNRTAVIDAEEKRTEISYDALNRTSLVRTSYGAVLALEYNHFGQVSKWKTPDGVRHYADFDAAGQRIAVRDSNGSEEHYEYDRLGNITAVTEETGRKTEYIYAPGGLLMEVRYPGGISEHFTYNSEGKVLSVVRDDGSQKHYSYDPLGRISSISTAEGMVRKYVYDPIGRISSVTDGNGNTTKFEYTGKGNMASVTDATGANTKYEYDSVGNLTKICRFGRKNELKETDAHITILENDSAGRVIRKTDPNGNSEEYTYDVMGRVTAKVDGDGFKTKYSYTNFGSIRSVEYADGRSVQMQYDELRRLSEIQDWLGTITFETDSRGQIERITDADGQSISYETGTHGERIAMTYPDGEKVNYSYDEALRLSEVNIGGETVRYQYDPSGRLVKKDFSSGFMTAYEYDTNGFLKSFIQNDQSGEVNRFRFIYDVMGNRISGDIYRRDLPAENGLFEYTYDSLNRLRDVSRNGKQIRSYMYDAFGNRCLMQDECSRTEYEYDASDRLLRSMTGSDVTEYRYDRRGNVSDIFRNGNLVSKYEYDTANRLAQSIEEDGTACRILYNGIGERVSETRFGRVSLREEETIDSLLNEAGLSYTIGYISDLTKTCRNLLQKKTDKDSQNFVWDGQPLLEFSTSGMQIYDTDEKGSVIGCLCNNGIWSEHHGYDEFGRSRQGEIWNQPLGYTGYQRDSARVWYAHARQYRPETGRFDGTDNVNGVLCAPGSLNRYTFCYNSPLIYADADGNLAFFDNIASTLEEGKNRIASGVAETFEQGANFVYDTIGSFPRLGEVEEQIRKYVDIDGIVDTTAENLNKVYESLPQDVKDTLKSGQETILRTGRELIETPLPFSGKTISDYMNDLSKSPIGRKVLDRFDFVSDENGVFHTTNNCWQIAGGYNDYYDSVFQGFTKATPRKFEMGEYTIWMWKGDYLNLGAGAEVGIYKGDGFQKQCATDANVIMSLRLYDKTTGELIFDYSPGDPDQWWINGFNPNYQDYDDHNLLAVTTIDFSNNPELWNEFIEARKGGNMQGWSIDSEHMTATFAF